MAETNTDGSGDSGGQSAVDRIMAFVREPLGMGLLAGIAISLGLGYYIL